MRLRIAIFLIPVFLFLSCEKDGDKEKEYEVSQLLDKGQFRKALEKLGDCSSSAWTKEECYTNRGAAYYGIAGYDITNMGEALYRIYTNDSLSTTEKNIKMTAQILSTFKGKYIILGVAEYHKVLELYGLSKKDCNSKKFRKLSTFPQQACIAINPILLVEVMDNKFRNPYSASIEDLADIHDSVRGIVPNISDEELASVLNGKTENISPETENELDATSCVINPLTCSEFGMSEPELYGRYENLNIYKISKIDGSFTTLKLVDEKHSVVLVKPDSYIYEDNSSCSKEEYEKFDRGHLCFPQPTDETLTTKGVEKLNSDEDFKTSIASMIYIGDNTKSSEVKKSELMTEICGYPNCEASESEIIKYLQGE